MKLFRRTIATAAILLAGAGCASSKQHSASLPDGPRRLKMDEAAAIEEAVPADPPRSPRDWVKKGNELMQQSRQGDPTGLYAQAASAYERALAADPKNAEAMIGMAWVHNSRHEFPEGIRWANEAIATDPRNADSYALLSDASVELGDYEAALDYCQAALDRAPNLSTYSRAAHLVWITGNPARAHWLMQQAIDAGAAHAENIAWCRAELAVMLFQTGALVPAEQQIDLALQLAPRNHHVLATAGRLKAARKDIESAIDFYERSIAQQASHDALVGLGDLYALEGRSDKAQQQYDRVIALHAGHAHSHGSGPAHVHPHPDGNIQLARFYADHDRNLDEALEEAARAYEKYKNVFTITTLAWCQYKKEQYEQAARTIRKALALGTPDPAIFFRAGMIEAKLGNRVQAQKLLYRALNLNPAFHPVEAPTAVQTLALLSGKAVAAGKE